MALYRLKDGSHTRGENGVKVRYKAGTPNDILTLTDAEAQLLRTRIEPYVASAAAPVVEAKAPPVTPTPSEPAPAPPVAEPTPEPPEPGPWDELLAGNVGHVTKGLAKITDPEQIREIVAAEKLGKDRTGVFNAAEERLAALENPEGA